MNTYKNQVGLINLFLGIIAIALALIALLVTIDSGYFERHLSNSMLLFITNYNTHLILLSVILISSIIYRKRLRGPWFKFIKYLWLTNKYDAKHCDHYRVLIKERKIEYLSPIFRSVDTRGSILQEWNYKINHTSNNINKARLFLFSDIYLSQELEDFRKQLFSTSLNLYAKTILLYIFVTLNYDRRLKSTVNENSKDIFWVITKQFPTDWPLCGIDDNCQKSANKCKSSNGSTESEYLYNYAKYLKACFTTSRLEDIEFNRYMLNHNGQNNIEINEIKSIIKLNDDLSSHLDEYKKMLHINVRSEEFGRSYKLTLTESIAEKWPNILNDAILGGTRHDNSADVNLEWAICSTYEPGYPSIVLRVYDLTNDSDLKEFKEQTNNLFSNQVTSNDDLREYLKKFTDFVNNNSTEVEF